MLDIFTKFRETVFCNENNRIENQIKEMKSVRKEMDKTYAIDKDIKLLEAGLQGEKNIIFELQNANIGMYVLQDVNIKFENLTAQIDFVIITKAYIYLVECKNLIGNITVNNSGEFKRKYNYNGKDIEEAIYSPLTQANRHKEILMKIWLSHHSKIISLLYEKSFDKRYKPLVVLANSKSLLNIQRAPKEVKARTIRVDQLINYIKNDIDKFESSAYLSKKNMEEIAETFLERTVEGNNNFVSKYAKYVKDNEENDEAKNVSTDVEKVAKELKKFRKNKSAIMKVPAYYIFSNEELQKMLELFPKTVDDLKNSNILSNIKLKCHGEEIVKIFNGES